MLVAVAGVGRWATVEDQALNRVTVPACGLKHKDGVLGSLCHFKTQGIILYPVSIIAWATWATYLYPSRAATGDRRQTALPMFLLSSPAISFSCLRLGPGSNLESKLEQA